MDDQIGGIEHSLKNIPGCMEPEHILKCLDCHLRPAGRKCRNPLFPHRHGHKHPCPSGYTARADISHKFRGRDTLFPLFVKPVYKYDSAQVARTDDIGLPFPGIRGTQIRNLPVPVR